MNTETYHEGYERALQGKGIGSCPWIGFDYYGQLERRDWIKGWKAGYQKRRRKLIKQGNHICVGTIEMFPDLTGEI